MKLSLPTNISRLRKEHVMTQTQLAEALGVTFASVSKWERGVATPELELIAEMADLFEVSIDALIGYEFRNNDRDHTIARLKRYAHDRSNSDDFSDIEKALQRYPNCFDVAYYSARVYRVRGLAQKNTEYSGKALSLYSRACLLIDQNADPGISEISIRREMASVYLALEEYEQGLELLKQYNPCRLNHPLIGYTLSSGCSAPLDALPYLSMALLDLTQTYMEIVMGYVNVYAKTGNYEGALALTEWALAFFPGLRRPEVRSYMDKSEASLWAIRGAMLLSLNRKEAARDSLHRAKTVALQFDESPSYDAANVRFVACQEPATVFDDMEDTAMLSLDLVIAEFKAPELHELWRAVRDEG